MHPAGSSRETCGVERFIVAGDLYSRLPDLNFQIRTDRYRI